MAYTLDEYWELPTVDELAAAIAEAEPEYPEASSEEDIIKVLNDYSEILDRSAGFSMYRERGGQEGVDFDIKLRNIDLGEQAPNYNEANDEAFGNYLMEVYFPDQMEYFLDSIWEISDSTFVKEDVSQLGRSGGHLVVMVGGEYNLARDNNPIDVIGWGLGNTIAQGLQEECLMPLKETLDALDKVEAYINQSLDFFATDMSEEREFFESEYGQEVEEEPFEEEEEFEGTDEDYLE